MSDESLDYRHVSVAFDRAKRTAPDHGPRSDARSARDGRRRSKRRAMATGRCVRSASSTMPSCDCGVNEPELGTLLLATAGETRRCSAVDRVLVVASRPLAGARNHRTDAPHAQTARPDRAQPDGHHRARLRLRRVAVRAGPGRRSQLHARRSRSRQRDRAVADERRACCRCRTDSHGSKPACSGQPDEVASLLAET